MIGRWVRALAVLALIACGNHAMAGQVGSLTASQGYTYGFWLTNPLRVANAEDYRFAVQTNQYGFVLNAYRGAFDRLGAILKALPLESALEFNAKWSRGIPVSSPLNFWIEVDGVRYQIVTAGIDPQAKRNTIWYDLRQMSNGTYLQHFDLLHVRFADALGRELRRINASIEFACWPEFFTYTVHLSSTSDDKSGEAALRDMTVGMDVGAGTGADTLRIHATNSASWKSLTDGAPAPIDGAAWTDVRGGGLGVLCGSEGEWRVRDNGNRNCSLTRSVGALRAGDAVALSFIVVPSARGVVGVCSRLLEDARDTGGPVTITAANGTPLSSRFDRRYWAHVINMPPRDDVWSTERLPFSLQNQTNGTRPVRLLFEKQYASQEGEPGPANVIGFSAFLADGTTRLPLGIPVQTSKNWHVPDSWAQTVTCLDVPPLRRHTLEITRVNAEWAGVPAISHAQLCLIGWGGQQQWDQVALGSGGEAICYDPYVGLGRAVIDDLRTQFVWGSTDPPQKWGWTENVGGADFLVLETDRTEPDRLRFKERVNAIARGEATDRNEVVPFYKQLPEAQKTLRRKLGPVLSEATYAGTYAEGRIRNAATVYAFQSDDYFRAYFHIVYKVKEPVTFTRLAFFQLGADWYNDNLFTSIVLGGREGLREQWQPPMGEAAGYTRKSVALDDPTPWFGLVGTRTENPKFAQAVWGDRVLIVHRWDAQLGGRRVPRPYYSVRGTSDQLDSAALELSPPPDCRALEKGDYVDAWLELAVLPQKPEQYYGPNEDFRATLGRFGGEAGMVDWVAKATSFRVDVDQGKLENALLPTIRAHRDRAAWSLDGGYGWIPITIRGVKSPGPYRLEMTQAGKTVVLEPSEDGSPIHQSNLDLATLTYDVSYGVYLKEGAATTFRFGPA